MRTKREVCLSVGTTKVVEKDVELIIASVQKRMSKIENNSRKQENHLLKTD